MTGCSRGNVGGQPEHCGKLLPHTVFPLPEVFQIFSTEDILEARGISVEPGTVLAPGPMASQVTQEWGGQSSMKNSPVSNLQKIMQGVWCHEKHGVWFLASSRSFFW